MNRTNPETELRELAQLVVDTLELAPYFHGGDVARCLDRARAALARPPEPEQKPQAEKPFPRFFVGPCIDTAVYVIAGPGDDGGRRFFSDLREWGGSHWSLDEVLEADFLEVTAEQAAGLGVPVNGPFPWMVPA